MTTDKALGFKIRNKDDLPDLILEDNPARMAYLINLMFQIKYPFNTKVIIVTTAKAAIEELARYSQWGILMLDHDLDGQVYTNSENYNTGYQVAKFIRDKKITCRLCIVHTLNEFAVPKMLEALKGCGKVVYKPCVDL